MQTGKVAITNTVKEIKGIKTAKIILVIKGALTSDRIIIQIMEAMLIIRAMLIIILNLLTTKEVMLNLVIKEGITSQEEGLSMAEINKETPTLASNKQKVSITTIRTIKTFLHHHLLLLIKEEEGMLGTKIGIIKENMVTKEMEISNMINMKTMRRDTSLKADVEEENMSTKVIKIIDTSKMKDIMKEKLITLEDAEEKMIEQGDVAVEENKNIAHKSTKEVIFQKKLQKEEEMTEQTSMRGIKLNMKTLIKIEVEAEEEEETLP